MVDGPVVAVKIDNTSAGLPQYGISEADLTAVPAAALGFTDGRFQTAADVVACLRTEGPVPEDAEARVREAMDALVTAELATTG